MTGRWIRFGAVVLVAGAVGLAGCGDEGDTSAGGAGGGTEEQGAAAEEEHQHGAEEEHQHGGGAQPAFAAADADTTVQVSMKDFVFVGLPGEVKGTKVLFKVTNDGPTEHEFVVFKEGDDSEVSGIAPFAAGKAKDLAVELAPGRYTVRCLVKAGEKTHADLGMQTDFSVG